jgi:hypothetical protein
MKLSFSFVPAGLWTLKYKSKNSHINSKTNIERGRIHKNNPFTKQTNKTTGIKESKKRFCNIVQGTRDKKEIRVSDVDLVKEIFVVWRMLSR